jgi:hypothetical protein
MNDDQIHEADCPHSDCEAVLRISDSTPAGVYYCWCHSIRVRLAWSTSIGFVRSPYLTLEPKEPAP